MTLPARFYRSVVYRATDLIFRRNTFAAHREVSRLRQLPRAALRDYQLDRLRTLIAHADAHVPYYREAFRRAGVRVADLRSLECLDRFPILGKEDVRANLDAMRSETFHGRWKSYPTSGSTGTPLVVLESQQTNAWRRAVKWDYLRWWDVSVGEPGAVIWLQPVVGIRGRLTKRLGFALNNCSTFLDVGDLSERAMHRFWKQLVQRRVTYLYGYTSAVTTFARFVLEERLNRRGGLALKVVVPTTETLFGEQRRLMREAFGCGVADEYGCAELGDIAFECPHGRMHVGAETYLVEIVPPFLPKADGAAGRIAVTHLRKTSLPMIRYAVGDVVHLVEDECPCGRSLPIIRSVEGRVSDIITTPDGRVVHSEVFDYIMREFASLANPAVSAFRAIQKSATDFEILVVPGPTFGAEVEQGITRQFVEVFGERARVVVMRVERIPADPAGKIRFFLSEARSGGDGAGE